MSDINYDNKTLEKFDESFIKGEILGRCCSVNKNSWKVCAGNKEYNGIINNSFRNKDLPTVGDYVCLKIDNQNDSCVVTNILPRSTLLFRKVSGTKKQELAANVDIIFVVSSMNEEFNISKIERLAIIAKQSGAKICFALTKSDTCQNKDYYLNILKDRFNQYPVIMTSSVNNEGIDEIRNMWKPNETAVLIGSSGVGKSTLINSLFEEEIVKTSDVREKDKKGRHTTTNRYLHIMPDNRIIIDEPGIREVGLLDANEQVNYFFNEISELKKKCKFSDCTHTNEPGCAILEAINEGLILKEDYDRYKKLEKKEKSRKIIQQEEVLNGYKAKQLTKQLKKSKRYDT